MRRPTSIEKSLHNCLSLVNWIAKVCFIVIYIAQPNITLQNQSSEFMSGGMRSVAINSSRTRARSLNRLRACEMLCIFTA